MDEPKGQVPDLDVSYEEMNIWIEKVCNGIRTLLIKRQEHYGNTIGHPLLACSKVGPRERAAVYIDQKLNRLISGEEGTFDDTMADIIGYTILKRALEYAQGMEFKDPLDLYIKFNTSGDATLLEPAKSFAHESIKKVGLE